MKSKIKEEVLKEIESSNLNSRERLLRQKLIKLTIQKTKKFYENEIIKLSKFETNRVLEERKKTIKEIKLSIEHKMSKSRHPPTNLGDISDLSFQSGFYDGLAETLIIINKFKKGNLK